MKATPGKGLKMLTPKPMFQRLPIVLAQAKAGNTSENLPNEIRQIICFLYQANFRIVALRQHQAVKDVFQRKVVISYSFFLRFMTIPMCFYDLILIIFHESLKICRF